jgi:hypothetical protein
MSTYKPFEKSHRTKYDSTGKLYNLRPPVQISMYVARKIRINVKRGVQESDLLELSKILEGDYRGLLELKTEIENLFAMLKLIKNDKSKIEETKHLRYRQDELNRQYGELFVWMRDAEILYEECIEMWLLERETFYANLLASIEEIWKNDKSKIREKKERLNQSAGTFVRLFVMTQNKHLYHGEWK